MHDAAHSHRSGHWRYYIHHDHFLSYRCIIRDPEEAEHIVTRPTRSWAIRAATRAIRRHRETGVPLERPVPNTVPLGKPSSVRRTA